VGWEFFGEFLTSLSFYVPQLEILGPAFTGREASSVRDI
jgi:hypothetical protein